MSNQKNERTLQMMENYIKLHNEGYSVSEIAKMYKLSNFTVYNYLGEIAEKAGLTREELLEKPFVADHSGRNFTPVKPVDRKEFEAHFNTAIQEIAALRHDIEQIIIKLESVPTLEKE